MAKGMNQVMKPITKMMKQSLQSHLWNWHIKMMPVMQKSKKT